MNSSVICPYCESTDIREHDDWCDDEHGPDDTCFPLYCNDCGEGFEEE